LFINLLILVSKRHRSGSPVFFIISSAKKKKADLLTAQENEKQKKNELPTDLRRHTAQGKKEKSWPANSSGKRGKNS